MKRLVILVGGLLLSGSLFSSPAVAEEAAPTYSGPLLERSTLTGDWGGARNDLAEKGFTFKSSITQIEQGEIAGGKPGSREYYGGRGDLTGLLDTGKAGLWPGGFLSVELEGNWAQSVTPTVGALSPVNTNQLFPIPGGNNVALPALNYAQFLSHYAGVTVGKYDTMSGDENEFAHGKGDTQFFNLAFSINPVALSVPYSTLGAGIILLPTADPHEAVFTFLTLSANGKASTDGFDKLYGDQLIFSGSLRVRTGLLGLTGHQAIGGFYSNKQYTSTDQRVGFIIENAALAKRDGTWAVYYNFDQFLYEIDKGSGRGVGLFGRFGASEGDPIPTEYFYSAGIGGKGLMPSRPLDRLGVGYYYASVQNPTFQTLRQTRSFLRDEWGFEAFYNVAVTPWLLVSPDIQVIGPAQKRQKNAESAGVPIFNGQSVDTATVVGLRVQVIL